MIKLSDDRGVNKRPMQAGHVGIRPEDQVWPLPLTLMIRPWSQSVASARGGAVRDAVLLGEAQYGRGPDGVGAFPSVATLVRYTGLSERTVRTCLGRLQAEGIIAPCDPHIVSARIKRPDRRPQGWDLDLSMVRTDLAEEHVGGPEHHSPARRPQPTGPCRPGCDGHSAGVQSPHPAAAARG
jgi:hypothetical protein